MATHISIHRERVNCRARVRSCPREGHEPDILSDLATETDQHKIDAVNRILEEKIAEFENDAAKACRFLDENYAFNEDDEYVNINTPQPETNQPNLNTPSLLEDVTYFKNNYRKFRNQVRDNENPLEELSELNKYTDLTLEEIEGLSHNIMRERADGKETFFGVEIEYIGRGRSTGFSEFLSNNLPVDSNTMEEYHSSSNYEVWRWEEDGTVSGEFISRILSNNPKSYRELAIAVKAMKENLNARPSRETGFHINMNAGLTAEQKLTLMMLGSKFEDTIFRLATNPLNALTENTTPGENRTIPAVNHRGSYWANPISNQPTRHLTESEDAIKNDNLSKAEKDRIIKDNEYSIDLHSTRGMINLDKSDSEDYEHGRIEYRVFDGSMNLFVIEAQLKIAGALTAAATRPETLEVIKNLPAEPLGTHRGRRRSNGSARRNLTGAEWEEDTRSFRQLVDILFDKKEDKDQMIALFSMTSWS